MCESYHYSKDRQEREKVIRDLIGYGNVVKTVTMSNANNPRPAVYQVSDTGVVTVMDVAMTYVITKMVASPTQLRRYFPHGKVPLKVWKSAVENVKKGYNKF